MSVREPRAIKVRDFAPERLFAAFPIIAVDYEGDFLDLVWDPAHHRFSPSGASLGVGSFFDDGRKWYFFGEKLCYMFRL